MVKFEKLPPLSPSSDKSHHIGSPTTSFHNPWPSFPAVHANISSLLRARFFDERPPFVPVPANRSELVQIQKPDFSVPPSFTGFRVTWIGHASFLTQCCSPTLLRPINILFDPVFAERTSPVTFLGPKRYTPPPCSLLELLDAVPIDVVCVSHNHYDHADISTLRSIYEHRKAEGQTVLFCVALGNPRWLRPLGIPDESIWEAEWWTQIGVSLPHAAPLGVSTEAFLPSPNVDSSTNRHHTTPEKSTNALIKITCTPSQHASARGMFDRNHDLWCSWAIELETESNAAKYSLQTDQSTNAQRKALRKALFFAGDTGYRTIPDSTFPESDITSLPTCPAFKMIGQHLGPFDLGLLPIGLCRPRHFMSCVHCNSTDSMDIHDDIKAKRSVGMHWGTVRGGISAQYEDVRDPPKEWEQEARKRGLKWREDSTSTEWQIGLMDVGESLLVE